jgi:hypothetical protein
VDFGRHDANVLSLMTTAVNKAGLSVSKSGIPAVKRAVGRKINPVNAAFGRLLYIRVVVLILLLYWFFKRVAEEATIVYAGL